jgi:hypothetical protein
MRLSQVQAMTRPRLQLHLSTLLIVSLLAGVFMWLNIRERVYVEWHCRGFPRAFIGWNRYKEESDWSLLILDGTVCLALLAVAAVAIEWATRRMKRKTTP